MEKEVVKEERWKVRTLGKIKIKPGERKKSIYTYVGRRVGMVTKERH